jgi:hypothetical protein
MIQMYNKALFPEIYAKPEAEKHELVGMTSARKDFYLSMLEGSEVEEEGSETERDLERSENGEEGSENREEGSWGRRVRARDGEEEGLEEEGSV